MKILYYGIGILFMVVGLEKAIWGDELRSYLSVGLHFSDGFSRFIAVFVPWLEFYCGLSFLFERWRPAGAVVLLPMATTFLALHMADIFRGHVGSCACMGGSLTNAYVIGSVCLITMMASSVVLARQCMPPRMDNP
jgi:hypothetical protein